VLPVCYGCANDPGLDPDLADVVKSWPNLSPEVKHAVLTLVKHAAKKPRKGAGHEREAAPSGAGGPAVLSGLYERSTFADPGLPVPPLSFLPTPHGKRRTGYTPAHADLLPPLPRLADQGRQT
jgi:hypothetical protein